MERSETSLTPLEGDILTRELIQRQRDVGVTLNEVSIVVCQSEERAELTYVRGLRIMSDGIDLIRIGANSATLYEVTEYLGFFHGEVTLFRLSLELRRLECRQYLHYLIDVLVE